GNVRAYDLQQAVPDYMNGTVYVPFNSKATGEAGQIPTEMTVAIRTLAQETQIAPALRKIVASANPDVPVTDLTPLHTLLTDALASSASAATLFVAFAALALVIGVVGIYGVLSFLVAKRTREIGIRLALGAQQGDVFWMVFKEGAKFYLVGISLGL